MRIVERVGDRGHDLHDFVRRQTMGDALQEAGGVGAVHVVHRYPQLAVELAAIMQCHDVRVPQGRDDRGLAVEPVTVFPVKRELRGQHLEGFLPGQPRVLSEVHLTHPARSQLAQNRISGKYFPSASGIAISYCRRQLVNDANAGSCATTGGGTSSTRR